MGIHRKYSLSANPIGRKYIKLGNQFLDEIKIKPKDN